MAALGGSRESGAIKKAARRAISKTTRWVRRRLAQLAASELGLSQSALAKARIRIYKRKSVMESGVWAGANDLAAHRFGSVRWTKRMAGARAGRRMFEGSFAVKSGPMAGKIYRRKGRDRFPLAVEKAEISPDMFSAMRQIERQGQARYKKVLLQELNYEWQKALSR